ncbi:MAG: hypothetical protein QOH12_1116 [Solirubrobacteraceae bacterium]|nr:hypothetical protein [Solirubrobacteraceae bacterium]
MSSGPCVSTRAARPRPVAVPRQVPARRALESAWPRAPVLRVIASLHWFGTDQQASVGAPGPPPDPCKSTSIHCSTFAALVVCAQCVRGRRGRRRCFGGHCNPQHRHEARQRRNGRLVVEGVNGRRQSGGRKREPRDHSLMLGYGMCAFQRANPPWMKVCSASNGCHGSTMFSSRLRRRTRSTIRSVFERSSSQCSYPGSRA